MILVKGLFWSLLLNGLFVTLFNRKFEETIPITYIISGLILYAFGLFEHISYGYYAVMGLSFSFIPVLLILLINNKKHLKKTLSNYFSFGFFVYIILFVYVYFMQKNRGFNIIDEFWNWGLQVREDMKYDSFMAKESLYKRRTYPPFLTIIEIFFCHLNGEFNEGSCFIGMTDFVLVCYLPLLAKLKISEWKDYLNAAVYTAVFLLLGCCISLTATEYVPAHLYNTLYVDFQLAVFAAYAFFSAYSEDEWNLFNIVNLILSMTVLLLLKQTGIAFMVLVIFYIAVNAVIKAIQNRKTGIRNIIAVILVAIVPVAIYTTWYLYAAKNDKSMEQLINLNKVRTFIDILFNDENEKHVILIDFIKTCFSRELVLQPFSFTYISYTLFVTACIFIATFFFDKEKRKGTILSLTYLSGSAAYAVARIFLYTSIYNHYESTNLTDFDRYMKSYLYIGTCLLFMLLIYITVNHLKNYIKMISCLAVLGLCVAFVEPNDLEYLKPLEEYNGILNEDMEKLKAMVFSKEEGSKFLFIEQYFIPQGYGEVLDYVFNGTGYTVDELMLGPEMESSKAKDLSIDAYLKLLSKYDYIYLMYVDDYFYRTYWEPLADDPMYVNQLYKIVYVNLESQRFYLEYASYAE